MYQCKICRCNAISVRNALHTAHYNAPYADYGGGCKRFMEHRGAFAAAIDAVTHESCRWMLRMAAEPKRRMRVTAPVELTPFRGQFELLQ